MLSFSEAEIRLLRLAAQRLLPGEPGEDEGATEVVQAVCGLQAQEASAAALGIRARSAGLKDTDVERARFEQRSLVRTWGPRGTLHLLAAADHGWLVALLRPLLIAGNKRRYRQLGLDEETLTRAVRLIRQLLSEHGPLTRSEIGPHLDREGIPTQGQALIYLIQRAALEGYVCLGPEQGSQSTYTSVETWIDAGPMLSREAALAELARRFLEAYAPAGPADLAAWSGLRMGDVREAWEMISKGRVEVSAAGSQAWMPAKSLERRLAEMEVYSGRAPFVRLVPRFDTYLLGYASRELAVPPPYSKRINAGGGIVHAAVLVDGRALGAWKIEKKRGSFEVRVEPFEAFNLEILPGLEAEASDIGRFYSLEGRLQLAANLPD